MIGDRNLSVTDRNTLPLLAKDIIFFLFFSFLPVMDHNTLPPLAKDIFSFFHFFLFFQTITFLTQAQILRFQLRFFLRRVEKIER